MKLHLAALAIILGGADAFVSRAPTRSATVVQAATATSFEEDLELTFQAIYNHVGDSLSKGGAVSSKATPTEKKVEPKAAVTPAPAAPSVDLSIPYDAAARLEFDAANKEFDAKKFEAFKQEYYTKTVEMVTAKKAARDGAATTPAPAKTATASKEVVAPKASTDISIDYDAAAKLSFTEKFGSFDAKAFPEYKKAYVAGAVAMVTAKQQVRNGDLSVPYDAAAKLAFMTANDNEFDAEKYAKFKEEFEAKAVSDVVAKQKK